MEAPPDAIFISYSRADGREFAEAFERRLQGNGIRSWRDLKSMESGDIRPQVLRAIEDVKHFVLILSRRALASDWIKREWSHARMEGKRVSPVLADPALERADLPPWMRREEVFDIDPARDRDAERWKALVLVLRGDGRTKRAPHMPGDLVQKSRRRTESGRGLFAASAAGKYRYSVAGDTPSRSATSATGISGLASNVLATSRSFSVSFGGRPPVRPARLAAARPARVRSRMRAHSNSASALSLSNTRTPCAVVVSITCVRCGSRCCTSAASRSSLTGCSLCRASSLKRCVGLHIALAPLVEVSRFEAERTFFTVK